MKYNFNAQRPPRTKAEGGCDRQCRPRHADRYWSGSRARGGVQHRRRPWEEGGQSAGRKVIAKATIRDCQGRSGGPVWQALGLAGSPNKQEYAPLLRPGLHPHTVDALERLCVSRFPESVNRAALMGNLRKVLETMQSNGLRGKVWVDGSFLTEKLNPDDVDLVFVVTKAELAALDGAQREFLSRFANANLAPHYRCDHYVYVQDDSAPESEYMHAYWLRQFGFSRGQDMKGVAVVTLPYVVMP
ncbi:MAG: hypothetical protein H6924_06020 [Alphaproteobacteria bacterium]|nr:hypothetical protein [Alphaproteobacteria bacterium]